jgi:hypothetical protein
MTLNQAKLWNLHCREKRLSSDDVKPGERLSSDDVKPGERLSSDDVKPGETLKLTL